MAQGKLKVKSKLPPLMKMKQRKNEKGPAINRRANAPIQQKKTKSQEAYKLKKLMTKTVNSAIEDELREKALDGKKSLVKQKKLTKSQNK